MCQDCRAALEPCFTVGELHQHTAPSHPPLDVTKVVILLNLRGMVYGFVGYLAVEIGGTFLASFDRSALALDGSDCAIDAVLGWTNRSCRKVLHFAKGTDPEIV